MAKSLDIIDPKKELARNEEHEEKNFENMPEEGGGGVFYLIIGIIAVVVAVGSALFVIYKDRGSIFSEKTSQTVTPTSTLSASPSATLSPSVTPSSSAQAAVSAQANQFSADSIRIANGNGINGEAARIKKLLVAKGYKIGSTGNATKNYSKTIIYYKSGKENLAKALQTDLTGEYASDITLSDKIVGTYDAVIALGAK